MKEGTTDQVPWIERILGLAVLALIAIGAFIVLRPFLSALLGYYHHLLNVDAVSTTERLAARAKIPRGDVDDVAAWGADCFPAGSRQL